MPPHTIELLPKTGKYTIGTKKEDIKEENKCQESKCQENKSQESKEK